MKQIPIKKAPQLAICFSTITNFKGYINKFCHQTIGVDFERESIIFAESVGLLKNGNQKYTFSS